MASLRHLLVIHLDALGLRDNGFPSGEDFEVVYGLEDQIVASMSPSEGRLVGHVTDAGGYRIYVYTARPSLHQTRIAELTASMAERNPSCQIVDEPQWDTYHNVLYPRPEDWQQIQDGMVLEALRKDGDDLSRPRQVDHWLFFDNAEACGAVADLLVADGFTVVDRRGPDEDNDQWTLHVCRRDSVQPEDITPLTVSLLHLANEHGGEYDGWETSVEK